MWSYSCWWWDLQSNELRWGELKADLELFNWSPQEQLCSWPSRVLLFKETDRFLSHSQSNFCSLFFPIPPLPFIANSSTWAMVKSLEMPCHAVKFSAMNQISMIGCEHIKKDRFEKFHFCWNFSSNIQCYHWDVSGSVWTMSCASF